MILEKLEALVSLGDSIDRIHPEEVSTMQQEEATERGCCTLMWALLLPSPGALNK